MSWVFKEKSEQMYPVMGDIVIIQFFGLKVPD